MTKEDIVKFNALQVAIKSSTIDSEKQELAYQRNEIYDKYINRHISYSSNGKIYYSFAELCKSEKILTDIDELRILNQAFELRDETDKQKAIVKIDLFSQSIPKDFPLESFCSPYDKSSSR